MTSDEAPRPETLLDAPAPTPETPDVDTMLERYRLQFRTRRQRRRRHAVVVVGALVGCGAALAVLLSLAPREPRATGSPTPEPSTPSATPVMKTEQGGPEPRAPEPPTAPASPAAPARKVVAPPSPPAPVPASPPKPTVIAGSQPRERLQTVRPGDAKEHVFEMLGGTVAQKNGTLVKVDGIRLRASGRSAEHPRVEVADVAVAENKTATRYWFLFGNDRLLAWGRPDEWPAAAARYRLEIDYR
jgi:hypothetical protein